MQTTSEVSKWKKLIYLFFDHLDYKILLNFKTAEIISQLHNIVMLNEYSVCLQNISIAENLVFTLDISQLHILFSTYASESCLGLEDEGFSKTQNIIPTCA